MYQQYTELIENGIINIKYSLFRVEGTPVISGHDSPSPNTTNATAGTI